MGHDRFRPTPTPRERRLRQCARFALTDACGQPIEVMVRDISSRGLSAAALGTPPPAESVVRARLEDGQELWGLVRWREGNLFGVEFDTREGALKPRS
ncbi:histidine kinase [Novosphingobium sp. MBES04]|uniref:histidine kinase n=1 Tax=Novosphingobium sp. MBES04 TaxID=1206458 RepID=UPI00057DBA0D|nr:histidine kinase [Novosphingobium sp. MBES04]GAM04421.1 histidine kinase [Novosphingobium sp. MBES04]